MIVPEFVNVLLDRVALGLEFLGVLARIQRLVDHIQRGLLLHHDIRRVARFVGA